MFKKIALTLAATAIPLISIAPLAAAQDYNTNSLQLEEWYTWKNNLGYKVRFPAHLRSTKDSKGHWEFSGPDYALVLKAWRNPDWNARQTAYHYYKKWNTLTNKRIQKETDITRYISQTKARGVLLEGSGTQQGHAVRFIFVGISNPSTGINMNLRFAWWNNPTRNPRIEKLVEKILGQIAAVDSEPNTPAPYGQDPFKEEPNGNDPFKDGGQDPFKDDPFKEDPFDKPPTF